MCPRIYIWTPMAISCAGLRHTGQAQPFENWPCYHTALDTFVLAGQTVGIVGCAVGAPFAVLIAEELFASNCQLLVSITSAGKITPAGQTPYFFIIDRARARVTTTPDASFEYCHADHKLVAFAVDALKRKGLSIKVRGELDHGCPIPPKFSSGH